jgi:hypothetical protein
MTQGTPLNGVPFYVLFREAGLIKTNVFVAAVISVKFRGLKEHALSEVKEYESGQVNY